MAIMLRIGLVPIVRPLFRGAKFGLQDSSEAALRSLGPQMGFELAYASAPISDLEAAQRVAREAMAANLDFLLVHHVTFATGETFVPFLELPIPVGLWALSEVWDSGPLPQNAVCGLNLGVSLATKPHKWFLGNPHDPWFLGRLELTLNALRGAKALQKGRILLLGGHAPGFFAFAPKPNTGLSVEEADLDLLWQAIEQVSPQDTLELAQSFVELSEYPLEALLPTFRLELALAQIAQGYDGIALREWPEIPDRVGVMAYSAMARLADAGMALAPEGDAMGLASMLALRAISQKPSILLDVSHFSERGVMLWHGGEAPQAWAGGPTRLVPHFNRNMPAVRDMPLKAGPITGLRLLPNGKAVVHGGQLNGQKGYDGDSSWLTAASWATQPLTPRQFLSSWLNHQIPHHMAVGMGAFEDALLEMCAWLGLKVLPPQAEEWRMP